MALIEYSNLGERSCGPERRNREDSAERTTVVRRGVAGGRGRVGAPPPRPQRELPQALGERGDDLRQLGERLGRDLGPFWTAARMVVDVAANLPSFRAGDESPADSAVCGEVAGNVDAVAGCGAEPEAELTFTMTDGRSVTLILSDELGPELADPLAEQVRVVRVRARGRGIRGGVRGRRAAGRQ